MKFLEIVGLATLAAIVFGILHDLVTAHLCVEYFTVGHPPIFPTESPVLLALGWGVVGTWWVGLLLGVLLACAARLGNNPKRDARTLVGPILKLLAVMAAASASSGLLGYYLASQGRSELAGILSQRIDPEKHVLFIAVSWAHLASYLVGFIGGVILTAHIWRSRRTQ